MKTKEIKIKFFNDTYFDDVDGSCILQSSDADRNWIDLRASEDVFVPESSFAMIPLGVAMQLPKGYESIVAPRSSTFKRLGVIQTNGIGIIDETYCGDNDQWFFPVFCLVGKNQNELGKRGTLIQKGTRICQFRIFKHQPHIDFHEESVLENENRGGFGSTGHF